VEPLPPVAEEAEEQGIDTRGIPSHECLNCGNNCFKIVAWFEDYKIAGYTTSGYCYLCGAPVTVPTEIDDPYFVRDWEYS
jgi:hypothetical protein